MKSASNDMPPISHSMRIVNASLCCSLGYNLNAASCAIRANMDHFQESEFITVEGEIINVGRLPDSDIWGHARLIRWASGAIKDCLQSFSNINTLEVPLVIISPELQFDSEKNINDSIISKIESSIGRKFNSESKVLSAGRAGLGEALKLSQIFLDQGFEYVLLLGADCLLNSRFIDFHLRAERLFTQSNRDGFIPAEAAAAILLETGSPTKYGLFIEGIGIGIESGRPDGSIPSRGFGLTKAVRLACEEARISPTQLSFRLSDQNGEKFFAKEASNTFTRLLAGDSEITHLTLADKIGEIGSATGPAALAYLTRILGRPEFNNKDIGVIHIANDNGVRSAAIVCYRGQ